MTSRADMEAVIEAVLFVANDPVSRERLAELFGEREREEAQQAVEAVVQRYLERQERGILIDEVAGGLRLVSRPDLHDYLRKFFELSSANRLSMPALETLAIAAYRQPVTAPEIQELRGVNSQGVLRTLLERRLIRISGRKEVVGKPFLYATTREFLLHFGLRSLKELPSLEQFEEMFGAEADDMATPVDPEETADRAAAAIRDSDDAASEDARRQAEDREREEEEARQVARDAELPGEEPEEAENSVAANDVVSEDEVQPLDDPSEDPPATRKDEETP